MAGGKRIRPILTLEFARLCGGAENAAIPAACSIEMMHTFSLIHDDLPCMDNDDMRRGRKSCHRQFDESTALLAGCFGNVSLSDIDRQCKSRCFCGEYNKND